MTRRCAFAVTALVLASTLAGCGGGEEQVALAIRKAERSNGTVLLHVECADDLEIEIQPDPAGSGLQQVTVWGDPRMGTCDPTDRANLEDLPGERFVDGATSQVVVISPSDLDPAG